MQKNLFTLNKKNPHVRRRAVDLDMVINQSLRYIGNSPFFFENENGLIKSKKKNSKWSL